MSDVELSCDEKAIAGYGTEEQKEYARTLLNCSQGKRYRSSRSAKDGDLERVKADGFVVMEDLHVTSGKEVWDDFTVYTEYEWK